MKSILVLFAHPAFQHSRVNRRLVASIEGLEGVTFHDLSEAYPDFHIDVSREQGLLESHQIIVFQHPFLWYSTPALLKEWQDLVLQHGWAYGHEGTALNGKQLLSVITAGGSEAAYQEEGTNRCTISDLLRPIERTAVLCGMTYLPPFVVHGTHNMTEPEIHAHADDYRKVLVALRDDRVDLANLPECTRLNADLDGIITRIDA